MSRNYKPFSVFALLLLSMGMLLAACGTQEAASTATALVPAVQTGVGDAQKTAEDAIGGDASPTAATTGTQGSPTTAGSACQQQSGELLIYSSLPLTGASRTQTVSVENGMRLALKDHNGTAGGFKVRYESLDDASAATGNWDPGVEANNANKAIQDKATVYLGTFNSGAAAISIPKLNAVGIPMISPANTAISLTKPGADPALLASLYKGGERNYFRVVPNDTIQGAADANWAKELGAKQVYILHDNEVYGKGVAQVFRGQAEKIGLKVLGYEGINKNAGSFASTMQKVVNAGADLVFFGGITGNKGPQVLKDLRDLEPDPEQIKFMGPDGIQESDFIKAAGEDIAEGAYATVAAAPPERVQGPGAEFFEKYTAAYNSEPEPYAIFGYDSMGVALAAIDKACSKDPKDVLKALKNIGQYSGALGTFSFDQDGDTTLKIMNGYQSRGGNWEWVKELSAE